MGCVWTGRVMAVEAVDGVISCADGSGLRGIVELKAGETEVDEA